MMEAEDYDAIRQRVEERFRQRSAFYTHLAVYTLVNIVLWVVYGLTTGMAWQLAARIPIDGLYSFLTIPWPLLIMGVWGIGLVAHGLNYYIRYGGGAIRREMAIQREIEREIALNTAYEKPKNDMRLTDDGEFEVTEVEPQWTMKRKHE